MANRFQTSVSTRLAGLAVMVTALAGCGQKGPLTLPPTTAATPAPTPAPAAAASAPQPAVPR